MSSAPLSSSLDTPTAALVPLQARGIVRRFPGRADPTPVLDGVDLVAAPGTRLGLIGENGSGKSTLLRILAGRDHPDAGTVSRPDDLVFVPQEPDPARTGTVGAFLDQALAPLHEVVATVERLAGRMAAGEDTGSAYDAALAWAVHHDAWDADRRAEVVAGTLGVDGLDRERPVGTLSGGQRTRLALAAALVRRPACLLLDEPTNHLDDSALELLEASLVDLPGVVVAASHDRTFLDRVSTDIVDLDAGVLGTDGEGGRRFGGGFTAYLETKAAARRRWEETYAAQQEDIARLREGTHIGTSAIAPGRGPRDNDRFIHAFKGANVERARARRVRDAERRLDTALREALPRPPRQLRFAAPLTGPSLGGVAVTVRDLLVRGTGSGAVRLRLPRLDVAHGEHVLVTGPNGSGKSSLLDVIAGRLSPDEGSVRVASRRTAYLTQDPELGDPARAAQVVYAEALGVEQAERLPLRSLGLLHPRDLTTSVGSLSVGQRRRLALAVAVATAPDLLLLDEPTNHVSLALAAELEEALGTAPGAVVVTSHDRWLRRRWADRQVALVSGT